MANEPMYTNEERAGRVEARNEARPRVGGWRRAEGPRRLKALLAIPLHIGTTWGPPR